MNHKSTIWAHTLFKNEERWLWYSVTSIINYVDKVLLWDTGSTDNSWKIAQELKLKYKNKIDLKQYGEVTVETFYKARQAMLNETDSDWFIVVDGDEIWWEDSISKVITSITSNKSITGFEAMVVPTVNLVGDIYHYLPELAGKYKFGEHVGNYNLRAIKRNIKGLHSQGAHGVWGWADSDNKQIQERNTFRFIDASYLHTTFLSRGEKRSDDIKVPKRAKKLKYEIGNKFPLDYYYPEVFFKDRPDFIKSPWSPIDFSFKVKATVQTPFRKINRMFIKSKIGY